MNDLLYIDRTKCSGCAACVDACPSGAIILEGIDGVVTISPALCNECLVCLDVCPTGAIRRAKSSELVPAGDNEIIEGQVIEDKVIPASVSGPLVAPRAPGRLATLAGTALAFVGHWLLPRAADALVGSVERRLTRGTGPVSSSTPLRSGNKSLTRQTGNGRRGRGRQNRRRYRGG